MTVPELSASLASEDRNPGPVGLAIYLYLYPVPTVEPLQEWVDDSFRLSEFQASFSSSTWD